MTVELVKTRGITGFKPMQAFLEEFSQPKHLLEIYLKLYLQCTEDDENNQKLVTAALKILTFARRSLSILELVWAVVMATDEGRNHTVGDFDQYVDHGRVIKSVKEFIISRSVSKKRGLQIWAASTEAATNETLFKQRIKSLERCIVDLCIKHLSLNPIGDTKLFSDDYLLIAELPQSGDLFKLNKKPSNNSSSNVDSLEEEIIHYDSSERGFGGLFVYASCHWIEYSGAISVDFLLPSLGTIEDTCQAGSIRLENWTTQNLRPNCRMKANFDFDNIQHDPLSIASLYGSEAMLRLMLEKSEFQRNNYLDEPAMNAATNIIRRSDLLRLKTTIQEQNWIPDSEP